MFLLFKLRSSNRKKQRHSAVYVGVISAAHAYEKFIHFTHALIASFSSFEAYSKMLNWLFCSVPCKCTCHFSSLWFSNLFEIHWYLHLIYFLYLALAKGTKLQRTFSIESKLSYTCYMHMSITVTLVNFTF